MSEVLHWGMWAGCVLLTLGAWLPGRWPPALRWGVRLGGLVLLLGGFLTLAFGVLRR